MKGGRRWQGNILSEVERAAIILNPGARNAPSTERLLAAARTLRPEGWEVELKVTAGSGEATSLARDAAAAGAHVVFACGGDGTLNEVANGLAGGEAALGVIRGGMGNVFAKEIGVPRAPEAALRVLLDGERRRFDLGLAGERYFIAMCGVGFDAGVVRRVPGRAKRLAGSASYAVWGALEILSHRSRRTRLAVDGGTSEEIDLYWLLLGNTRSYGGVIDITAGARVDDGCLDAYVFAGGGLPWLLGTALRVATKRQDGGRGVGLRRLRELTIETVGLPVQADGEYLGETPMAFAVAAAALTVLLPPGGGGALFSA